MYNRKGTLSTREIVKAANARTLQSNAGGWGERHCSTYHNARLNTAFGLGAAVVQLIEGAGQYADAHQMHFDSLIGHDYVLGEGFVDILKGARTLLNGELEHLDAGTLDAIICGIATNNGVDPDTWDLGFTPDVGGPDNA